MSRALSREEIMRSMLRAFALALMIASALPFCDARAQGWPARPVTLIVPFPAGGNADVLARALAAELSEKLGQQFIVDNRTGAGGNIGGAAVAKAAPDDTLMFGTPGPIATNKLMYKSLPYDPEKDLTPVVLVAKSPLIIAAHPSFPAKDLKELIAYAEANPGKVNAGNSGNGTLGHITSELLQQHTGTRMTHVPYRGTTPLTTDLLGGQIDIALDFVSTYIPLVRTARCARSASHRASECPSCPT
jgi:tripartite-type tricarboxylate transporter receptor subunit TctC